MNFEVTPWRHSIVIFDKRYVRFMYAVHLLVYFAKEVQASIGNEIILSHLLTVTNQGKPRLATFALWWSEKRICAIRTIFTQFSDNILFIKTGYYL